MALMDGNKIFDKVGITGLLNLKGSKLAWREISASTKTLTYDEAGLLYYVTYAGTCAITLPANTLALKGRWFLILQTVDQTLSVAAATVDTLIADGDIAADSVAFSTSSHKAGGLFLVIGTGAAWAVVNMSVGCTMTVTTN